MRRSHVGPTTDPLSARFSLFETSTKLTQPRSARQCVRRRTGRQGATMLQRINIPKGFIATGTALALLAFGLAPARAQQDCPRGDLDKAYCDRDGDMVADAPTDPKQFVNPSTL